VNIPNLSVWYWVAGGIGTGVSATGAFLLARWSPRCFLTAISSLSVAVYLLVVPSRFPPHLLLSPDIPPIFVNYFWQWVLAFALGMVLSLIMLLRVVLAARPNKAEILKAELAERFPELTAAWHEIEIRLSQAPIDPRTRRAVVILAPNEEWAAALVDAGGAPLFARAPDTAAPVHGFAISQAILITASGSSGFGTQEPDGPARMEALGRLIRSWNPECPPLRGVVVVFPIRWSGQPDSVKWAATVRDDLQALQRATQVRSPVFAVFTEMETVPGFAELLARMPDLYKQGRCGFAIPASQTFGGELIQGGLDWMARWFHGWAINLMSEDLLNHAGNQLLFGLDLEFRRYRKRLRALIEAAFSTHPGAEPVVFRGCYFTATGAAAEDRAFASALLGGPLGRVHFEHKATCWTAEALEDDRFYRRAAIAVGSVGALLSVLGWMPILIQLHSPWRWVGLVAITSGWVIAVLRLRRWQTSQFGSPMRTKPAQ
jgi:type VI secretion system protein ImpL